MENEIEQIRLESASNINGKATQVFGSLLIKHNLNDHLLKVVQPADA